MLKLGKKKDKGAAATDAEVPAVVEGETGAEGDAPKKKKLPLLFIIAPAALLVLGGGGGAAFFLMQPKPEAAAGADAHGAEKKGGDHGKKDEKKGGGGHGGGGEAEADPSLGKISEGPDGVTFYTLPDMVANVQSADGRPVHLKLKLTLEMQDAALAEHLQTEAPRLRDMFQTFMRELRPEEMQGSAATFQLKAELLRRANLIAAPAKVDAVLIEEMLVQ